MAGQFDQPVPPGQPRPRPRPVQKSPCWKRRRIRRLWRTYTSRAETASSQGWLVAHPAPARTADVCRRVTVCYSALAFLCRRHHPHCRRPAEQPRAASVLANAAKQVMRALGGIGIFFPLLSGPHKLCRALGQEFCRHIRPFPWCTSSLGRLCKPAKEFAAVNVRQALDVRACVSPRLLVRLGRCPRRPASFPATGPQRHTCPP